jgi:hypothetical protein
MDYFKDIWPQVLKYVCPSDLISFERVCKQWQSIINIITQKNTYPQFSLMKVSWSYDAYKIMIIRAKHYKFYSGAVFDIHQTNKKKIAKFIDAIDRGRNLRSGGTFTCSVFNMRQTEFFLADYHTKIPNRLYTLTNFSLYHILKLLMVAESCYHYGSKARRFIEKNE